MKHHIDTIQRLRQTIPDAQVADHALRPKGLHVRIAVSAKDAHLKAGLHEPLGDGAAQESSAAGHQGPHHTLLGQHRCRLLCRSPCAQLGPMDLGVVAPIYWKGAVEVQR